VSFPVPWGAGGKGGKLAGRKRYASWSGTDKPRERSILRPAASGDGGAGLRPAGAVAGQGSGWSERAQLYRDSPAHREGKDLDLIVEWAEGARTALDVATGGGHVARRLREAGLDVVTLDPAPGMEPDVVSRGEELPFADATYDVVACRVAAHHFEDVETAVAEMARVSRSRVIVVDNLFMDERAEEADRVRDPSHVRNYTEQEWRELFSSAGLRVKDVRRMKKTIQVDPWLERAATPAVDAARVRELLADRIADGWITLDRIAILGEPG
jgi:SAM-dependent methyltransferase